MSEGIRAIAYTVYAPTRKTFLGKLGSWYSDVRLASVYAEPRAAKMAAKRCEAPFPVQVVEVSLSVTPEAIRSAEEDAVRPADPVEPSADTNGDSAPTPARRRRTTEAA